jgi:hypothetical protein
VFATVPVDSSSGLGATCGERGPARRSLVLRRGTALQAGARNKNKREYTGTTKKDASKRPIADMNVLVFITDQQRAIMHFAKNWAAQNLPSAERLRRKGLTFTQATCNACMCSRSRAMLLTRYFPAQHGGNTLSKRKCRASGSRRSSFPSVCRTSRR